MTNAEYNIETTYSLIMPFDFGGKEDARGLTLKCPTGLHMPITSKIDQLISSSQKIMQMDLISAVGSMDEIASMAELGNSDQEEQTSGHAQIELMKSAEKFDEFAEQFKALMCSNKICLINGEVQMKNGWYDLMHKADILNLMECYLTHFFMQ
jgi:hypothetical protein